MQDKPKLRQYCNKSIITICTPMHDTSKLRQYCNKTLFLGKMYLPKYQMNTEYNTPVDKTCTEHFQPSFPCGLPLYYHNKSLIHNTA